MVDLSIHLSFNPALPHQAKQLQALICKKEPYLAVHAGKESPTLLALVSFRVYNNRC
jgi:hypothetical protein